MASHTDPLIVVSTRLPVSVTKNQNEIVLRPSNGGLATAVGSTQGAHNRLWVGWPGIASDNLTQKDKQTITRLLKKHGCAPVFLTQKQIDLYYLGYCNATLWPLFHYFPNRAKFSRTFWEAYQEVNRLFADAVGKLSPKNARFWVHDYQLMLLPKLLREKRKLADIGFFLHTPFPSFEILRLLPERKEILQGLMGANLVGFHTYDYVRHFLNSVSRLLGHDSALGTITYNDRYVHVDAFPIGIDYKKFAKAAKQRGVRKMLRSFNLFKQKTKVILTVDRTDYSKGIPARLEAYAIFLRQNPEFVGKVVMVVLAMPSREGIEEYDLLRQNIEQRVGRINGEFSTADWSPLVYRHQSLPFEELSALYSLADVMLVTPIRDGMNLVAKEFVASKYGGSGVLILSEMAGAAIELPEAILVNPNDALGMAEAIKEALTMPPSEQHARMLTMQERTSVYTAQKWAEDFLDELSKATEKQKNQPKVLLPNIKKELVRDYIAASSRLILLDYDGTLRNFVPSAQAHLARPTRKLDSILKTLTQDPRNRTVIVSGRPKTALASFFSISNLGLVAEHGGWVFTAGRWIKARVISKKWKKNVEPILQQYANRTPGAWVENKDFALVWHYREVLPDLAYVRKHELKTVLQSILSNDDIDVFEGDKILEIKPKRMHKGAIATELTTREKWDFIMAIGDDYTDEDMFVALPERAYTIKVGHGRTRARYQLDNVAGVLELLDRLSKHLV